MNRQQVGLTSMVATPAPVAAAMWTIGGLINACPDKNNKLSATAGIISLQRCIRRQQQRVPSRSEVEQTHRHGK